MVGAGGVYPPPPGYLAEVRAICRDSGVLFVADEVITGFGRTGAWFASTRWGLEPDLITCAKGLTSGYLPMGAVVAQLMASARANGDGGLDHSGLLRGVERLSGATGTTNDGRGA